MNQKYLPPELAGEYEVVKILQELGERQTFLLRRRDGALVILKRTVGDEASDERVFNAVRSLNGDGVPRMLELFDSGGAHWLLREYVEGETLLELCRRRGHLSERETAGIGAQICGVLERMHALPTPLIHRDIKAENIVMTPDGRCVLIDFGIARLFDQGVTRDTQVMGTGFAAAPEQFGYSQTDPRSDIYSLGVLLHELSTGECALDKGEMPRRLRHVVNRCTRFDPADRYKSAAELKKALARIASRKSRIIAAAAAAVLAAVSLAAVLTGRDTGGADRIYSFASPQIGQEVARQLGKSVDKVTYGDLDRVTSLLLCGGAHFDNLDTLSVHGEEINFNGQYYPNMNNGDVDDLTDIPNMPNLTELALCNEKIEDLSALAGCGIVRLSLHGNNITDLTPLSSCLGLVELDISDNPLRDLSPLAGCLALWRLNIGATAVSDLGALKDIKGLAYLEIHDCVELRSVSGIEEIEKLRYLSVRPVSTGDLAAIGKLTYLKHLYIWSPDELEDLSVISGLVYLERLYLHIPRLHSLNGIEGFKSLYYMDARSDFPLDAGPLAELTALGDVNLEYLTSDDWAELRELENLKNVTCVVSQEAAVRESLGDRKVSVYVNLER